MRDSILKKYLAWLAGVLIFILLQSCASKGESVGFYSLPVSKGDQLEVKQALVVRPGNSRVYLQYGTVMPYSEINQYESFCFFRMNTTLPVQQRVETGLYTVTVVSGDEVEVVQMLPVDIASRFMLSGDGGYGPITYQLTMRLDANDVHTELRDLVCLGGYAAPYDAMPVHMDAIRSALGELADFTVSQEISFVQ